jgi:ribosomal protein S7
MEFGNIKFDLLKEDVNKRIINKDIKQLNINVSNELINILQNEINNLKPDININEALAFAKKFNENLNLNNMKFEDLENAIIYIQIRKTSEELEQNKQILKDILITLSGLGVASVFLSFLLTVYLITKKILISKQ